MSTHNTCFHKEISKKISDYQPKHLNLSGLSTTNMSRVMRKPAFCICENKDADQLRGNREADQRLCFRYTDSTIPLLPKSKISSLQPSCVDVQPGLCRTWSETPKTGFLKTRLICLLSSIEQLSNLIRYWCIPYNNKLISQKLFHIFH